MPKRDELTSERVRDVLDYNPNTGVFTWRKKSGNRCIVGNVAGNLDSKGYYRIGLNGHQYRAHRIAWLHYHGKWPTGEIDHINNIRTDNRISNLRPAAPKQNIVNRSLHSNNKTGLKGVYRKPNKTRYCASITVDGKSRHLGYFATPEEAHKEYCRVARATWGDYFKA